MVHSQYKANDDYFVHNLFTRSNTLGMTKFRLDKQGKFVYDETINHTPYPGVGGKDKDDTAF